ncbi:spore germination protein KB [Gracilibacillus ureilyticus]|uniref:Spore germination protein KB n=1 Tax=Gracilibacillus ureilyticus TaxID=531814 RepID=A0A1H9NEW8_9BACI|nr:endospore germination permease [Gracilibacillus ureilyticus]SER33913.1 spore germination protein KB [Gracilibacillus ureilyticus]
MIEKIDGRQFTILVIMNTLGASIIFIPSIAASIGKENGWLTVIIATLSGLLIILLYNAIINQQMEKSIFSLIEETFGKWLGFMLIIFFNGYIYLNAVANVWSIGDFMSLQILMGTPEEAIELLIVITALIAVRYGMEVIGRTAEVFIPFTLFFALLVTILVMKDANIENIQPVFQLNRIGTFVGALPIIGITYLELFILLGMTHKVNRPKSAKRGLMLGGFISGGILSIITFACIMVLGVKATTHYTYPIYALGQRISIMDFFERIEILVAFIWFFTIFFKICISYYVLETGLNHLFKLKDNKTFSIPLALLLFFGATIMVPNTFNAYSFISGPYFVVSFVFAFILPVCILLASIARKKVKKMTKNGTEQSKNGSG